MDLGIFKQSETDSNKSLLLIFEKTFSCAKYSHSQCLSSVFTKNQLVKYGGLPTSITHSDIDRRYKNEQGNFQHVIMVFRVVNLVAVPADTKVS